MKVYERIGKLLRGSLLLLFVGFAVAGVAVLLATGIYWLLHQFQPRSSHLTIWVISHGCVGLALLVFSRFLLAIPAVILDNYRIGQAIFRSDELTERKWLTLAALLSKSVVGGYMAGMAPFWVVYWIPTIIPFLPWYPRLLTLTSIAGVTLVEPTMFIGFALLYVRMSEQANPRIPDQGSILCEENKRD